MSIISGLLAKSSAKKAREQQEAANQRTETQAKEASALDNIKADPGADIVFGAAKDTGATLRRKARKGPVAPSTGVFGGIGGFR